mgnify:FL=1
MGKRFVRVNIDFKYISLLYSYVMEFNACLGTGPFMSSSQVTRVLMILCLLRDTEGTHEVFNM